jgi:hypothetical protein
MAVQMMMFMECLECGSRRMAAGQTRVWLLVPHPENGREVEVIGDVFHCLACGAKQAAVPMGPHVYMLPVIEIQYQARRMGS